MIESARGGPIGGVYPEPFGCAQDKLRRWAQDRLVEPWVTSIYRKFLWVHPAWPAE